ncbi:MAG: hypothetical protein FWG64_12925 [Firmicutes bacterium]|nr:hypothetical protein [Bacillota bacterium]
MAKNSKARIKANQKYAEKTYYRVVTYIPKAQEQLIKQYAADNKITVNKLICNFIADCLDKPPETGECEMTNAIDLEFEKGLQSLLEQQKTQITYRPKIYTLTQGKNIRYVIIDGEPWFVQRDLVLALNMENHHFNYPLRKTNNRRKVRIDARGYYTQTFPDMVLVNFEGLSIALQKRPSDYQKHYKNIAKMYETITGKATLNAEQLAIEESAAKTRNYAREHELSSKKYTQIKFHIEKELLSELKTFLSDNGVGQAEWFRGAICDTIKNGRLPVAHVTPTTYSFVNVPGKDEESSTTVDARIKTLEQLVKHLLTEKETEHE